MRRLILWSLVVAALGAVTWVAVRPARIDVEVDAVTRGALEVALVDEGRTRVTDRYVVSAPVAGRLTRIAVHPGDRVRRGQTLAVIAPAAPPLIDARARREAAARVETADAAVAGARAAWSAATVARTLADRDRERAEVLARAGATPQSALDGAVAESDARRAAERQAAATLDAALHALDGARAALTAAPDPALRAVPVVAPIDGAVLDRLRESEAVVPAGEPLVELADPGHLDVVADLLSTDAVRILPGTPVHLVNWGGAMPLTGRVARVEPRAFVKVSALGVEEQRVRVIATLDTAPPPSLGDGYRVEFRVIVWAAPDVLRVPAAALFRHGNAWAVFRVVNGRARLVPVEIGHRGESEAEILSGLTLGDQVIVHPPDAVLDGTRLGQRRTGSR